MPKYFEVVGFLGPKDEPMPRCFVRANSADEAIKKSGLVAAVAFPVGELPSGYTPQGGVVWMSP